MADASDRVIPATPRRREAARRQGVMPSAALPAWAAAAAVTVLLVPAWAAATLPAAAELIRAGVRAAVAPADARFLVDTDLLAPVVSVALPTLAIVAAAAGAAVGVRLVLDGVTWQPSRLLPSLRRIDPFAGCGRIFSWQTASSAAGAVFGLALLVVVATAVLRPLAGAEPQGISGGESRAAAAAWRAAAWLVAAGAAVAACRWLVARRRFENRIRMTPEEFAEEARSVQSDPKIKLLLRQARRQPTAGAA